MRIIRVCQARSTAPFHSLHAIVCGSLAAWVIYSSLLRAGHGLPLSPAAALAACLSGAPVGAPAAGARADVLLALLRALPVPESAWGSLMASLLAADGLDASGEAIGFAMDVASGDKASDGAESGEPEALEADAGPNSAQRPGSGPGYSNPVIQEQCAAAASAPPAQRLRLAALLVKRLAASLGPSATLGHKPTFRDPAELAAARDPGPCHGDLVSAASELPAGIGHVEGHSADAAEAWRSETLDQAATWLVGSPLLVCEPAAAQVRAGKRIQHIHVAT